MSEGKRIGATLLAILAAVALLFAAIAGYATDALFDSDEFAERATVALDDEAVSAEIATRVTDDLVLNAQRDLVGARPLIEGVVDGIVGGSVFQSLFRSGISDVHRSIFSGDANTATLTLADVGEVLRGAIQALRPQLAKQVPGGVDIEIAEINPPAWLADAAHVAGDVETLAWVLLALALILAAAALFVSPDRRRTVMQIGVAIVICGVVGVVGAERRARDPAHPGRRAGDTRRGRGDLARVSGRPDQDALSARRDRGGDRRRRLVAAAPGRHRRAAAPRGSS